MIALFVLVAIAAGIGFGLQGPINAGLARYVGGPGPASLISFSVGLVTTAMAVAIAHASGHPPALRGAAQAPWFLFLGGLLGGIGVFAMTASVPRLGAGAAISAMMAGQVLCALVVDRFGLFGVEPVPLYGRRVLGAALLVVAVWLTRR